MEYVNGTNWKYDGRVNASDQKIAWWPNMTSNVSNSHIAYEYYFQVKY